MNTETIHSVYFSPTGTTRTVTRAVSRGFGRKSGGDLDLTQGIPQESPRFSKEDLVIIGMPVYSGRLPKVAAERLQSLQGRETPAVAIVVYGNRAYDDALVELCDLCASQGFQIVAAGALVGEHSFSSAERPIAPNRPDPQDVGQAEYFGRQTRILLDQTESLADLKTPVVPGNRPYKPEMQPSGAATETDLAACQRCGKCVEICPTQCIRMEAEIPKTDPEHCIWCMACVRNCPAGARIVALPRIDEIAQRLHDTCQIRKEPEWFPASGA